MSSQIVGALVGGVVPVLASAYLARLTLSVPDDDESRWWRGRPVGRGRVLATALVGAGLGVLGGLAAGFALLLLPFLLLALAGAPLIVIDYEHHRLPNRLVFAVVLGAPVLAAVVAADAGDWYPLLRAAEGAVAVFVVLFLLVAAVPKSFGYGDVKLGGILGGYLGWFGWAEVYYGIFGGFVLGSVVSLVLLAGRRATMKTAIPFGPMLIVGALVVLAFDLVPNFG